MKKIYRLTDKFEDEWEDSRLNFATDFMKQSGLITATFKDGYWYMTDRDYLLYLIRWG